MPNGKPGDHPITDIIAYNRVVFGEPWDSELREIVDLLGHARAHEWFDPEGWSKPDTEVRLAISRKLAALRKEGVDSSLAASSLAPLPAGILPISPRFGVSTRYRVETLLFCVPA